MPPPGKSKELETMELSYESVAEKTPLSHYGAKKGESKSSHPAEPDQQAGFPHHRDGDLGEGRTADVVSGFLSSAVTAFAAGYFAALTVAIYRQLAGGSREKAAEPFE